MQINYTNAIGSGAVGGSGSSGCGGVGSITWETPLESFLQASTIASLVDEANSCSLKDIDANVISVIKAEQGKGLSPEAFMYNGESALYDRSNKLVEKLSEVDATILTQVVEGIQSAGNQHRYEEAYTSYCKRLEEYSRRYNEELCPAVDTYNSNVTTHNINEGQRIQGDPTYQASYAQQVTVTAGQETAPSMSGTPNGNISGAAELNQAFQDCTNFYNEYVVPAKELHDECSQLEYVTPQDVPQFDFPKHPKEWYENVGDFFVGVGKVLFGAGATVLQVGSAILNGALHVVEGIGDGILWAGGHILGGIVGGLGILFGGDGSAGEAIVQGTNNAIAYGWSDALNEAFYSTGVGQALDNAALFRHDSGVYRGITVAGEVATTVVAATAATILSGGTALPFILGAAAGIGSTSQNVYQRTGGKDTPLGTVAILGMGAISGVGWALTGNMGAGFVEGLTGIAPRATSGFLGAANDALASGPLGGALNSAYAQGGQLGARFAGTRAGGAIASRFAPEAADLSATGAMDGATGAMYEPAAANGAPASAADSAFSQANMSDDAFNAMQGRLETDALRNAGGSLDAAGVQHAPASTSGAPASASESAFSSANMSDDAFNAMQTRQADALRQAGGSLDASGVQHAPASASGAPASASESAFSQANMSDDAFNAMQTRQADALRNAGGSLDASGVQHAPASASGAPASASESAFATQSSTTQTANSGLTNAQLAGRQGGNVTSANRAADAATDAINTYGVDSPQAQEAISTLQDKAIAVNNTGDEIAARGLNSSYGTGHVVTGPNAGASTRAMSTPTTTPVTAQSTPTTSGNLSSAYQNLSDAEIALNRGNAVYKAGGMSEDALGALETARDAARHQVLDLGGNADDVIGASNDLLRAEQALNEGNAVYKAGGMSEQALGALEESRDATRHVLNDLINNV